MEKTVLFITAYILEAFILWQFCSCMFISVYTKKAERVCLFVLYSVLFIVSLAGITWINTIFFMLFNFIFILILYKETWYSAVFYSLVITIAMNLSELVVISCGNLAPTFFTKQLYARNMLILIVSSKLLYFFVLQIIIHILKKSKKRNIKPDKGTFLLNTVPVISLVIVIILITICLTIPLPRILSYMVSMCTVLLLVINILVFYTYNYIQNKNYEFTKLQMQIQKENSYSEYYSMLIKQDENQKILIHDIKKHLMSISGLNENGEKEKIAAYIGNIINSPGLRGSVQMCGNALLNSILCHYASICNRQGTMLHTDIRAGLLEFMADNDLTALFCNLLDNATEATEEIPDAYIDLSVTCKKEKEVTIISLVNSCNQNPFSEKTGRLVSHKNNNMYHGYGIKSIQITIKKYNGKLQVYYDEKNKTFHNIILFKKQGGYR